MDLSKYYRPFARQQQFHDSPAKYRLFGGAAGPGKTKALLWEAIFQALAWRGVDTLLLRRTYPELESSLLAYFRRDVPRSLYKKYNEAKHIVTWHNGSTTRFGYCRNESDVYRYQGAEFLFIGLDELTHFTLKQWQFLTSRNRCPVRGSRPCMAGATNPGNIGHAWVKALWVDRKPPAGFDEPGLYNPNDYDFIRARLFDNPIYADNADYRRTLETLPEHLRRAFLDGDWNVFAGQYFDLFDYGRHTARPEEIRLEPWYPRWISIDWGFQHPSAVYWHCVIPAERNTKVENRNPSAAAVSFDFRFSSNEPRIVTYREFVQNGLSPRMLAQAIAERSGRENITEIFLSPDAFAHRTAEASIAEQLSDVLIANGLPHPAHADDDRIGGWQYMYQLLEANAWLITENCAKLIDCMPTLVRDTSNVEDIRKMDGDDPADSARYGLVSGVRFAGVGASAFGGKPRATHTSPHFNVGAGFSPSPVRDRASSTGNPACAPTNRTQYIVHGSGASEARDIRPGFSPSTSAPRSPHPDGLQSGVSGVGAQHAAPDLGKLTAAELEALRRKPAVSPDTVPHDPGSPGFVTGMPLDQQIARQISAKDPTSVAIHSLRLESEAKKHFRPKSLPRRRR